MLYVKQIGDKTLHTPPANADLLQLTLVKNYINILHETENLYGGVGIACNQCANISSPVKIFITGIDDEKARAAAQKRYPNETIPYTTIMLNPIIISYSQEMYYPTFGEGCLSVAGCMRGKVKRH